MLQVGLRGIITLCVAAALSFGGAVLIAAQPVQAHSGGLSADGAHHCWTNCERYGYVYGTRHCHQPSWGCGVQPRPPVPPITPIPPITTTNVTTDEVIPFTVENREDPNMRRGTSKKIQNGSNGSKKITFDVKTQNGREISRAPVKEQIVKEPQNTVIMNGTLDRSGGPVTRKTADKSEQRKSYNQALDKVVAAMSVKMYLLNYEQMVDAYVSTFPTVSRHEIGEALYKIYSKHGPRPAVKYFGSHR